jgi:hypothetical protein
MSNQEFIPASEFCDLVTDGTHDSPKKTEFGVKLVTSKNIVGGKLDLTSAYFISESDAQNINKRSQVHINDILLSMIGTVGEVALIEKEPDFVIKNVGLLKNSDPKKAKWLYYYLKSPITQNLIKDRLRGTTQQYIPLGELRNLPILKPNSEEHLQNTIDQLSSLDKKIQLNTQINQTLEQIAQALFKSWFVDFDPVRAKVQALSDGLSLEQAELAAMQAISGKTPEELTALSQTQPDRYAELAETAKAFPCEMVEVSNSIYIPKGWKIKYFNEIIDTYIDNRGKTPPIEKQGIPLLEVKHLPKNSVFPDLNTTKYISNDTYENWLRNKPEALDIMLSTVGTVGRVNLVPTNNKIAIAQNILGFRFNLEKATQIYMFYLMKSEKFIFDMEARVVETVQKSIKRKDLEKIPLLIPTLELQNLFSKFVIPFVIKQNNSENTNLEKIRNDLLPKLLSGEIQL